MNYLLALLLLISSAQARNVATGPFAMFVDNSGNDANDGLTFATAKQHYCIALRAIYYDWDFRGNQPHMFVTSGQQFNEMCGSGGTLVGANEVIIAPYDPANPSAPDHIVASPNFLRTCSPTSSVGPCGSTTLPHAAQWCDAFGDLAIQIYYNATWADCNHWNMEGGAAIVMHNPSVGDWFGPGTIFSGSGDNDSAILCDGPCVFTVGGGAEFNGQFRYSFQCNRSCNATVSGPIKLNFTNIEGIYGMYSGSHLNLGASYPTPVSSIIGPSLSSGFSNIIDHGTVIPGGTSMQKGGQFCDVMC